MIAWALLGGCAALPFRPAVPIALDLAACRDAAPDEVTAALREGVRLPGADARRIFPAAGLDPGFVRAVEVRAREVAACDGWVVARGVRVRLLGPGGAPMEAGVGAATRPGPVLAVHGDDVATSVPAGAWRVVARDTLAREEATVLGRLRGYSWNEASSSSSAPSSPPGPTRSSDR